MSARRRSLNDDAQFLTGDKGELIAISDTHEIIEPWPRLRATGLEMRKFTGLYEATAFQLWSRLPEERVLQAWFQQIPQTVRDVIQWYRAGKYQIARMCSLGECQMRLAKENMGVATALAVELDRTHKPSETTEEIYRGVPWGRRDMLRLAGFEPRPAVWRTLARMTPAAAVPASVWLMKELLDDWALRRLGYVCRISPDVVVMLCSSLPRSMKTVQLLQAAAETGEYPWGFRGELSVTGRANRILAASRALPKPDTSWTKLRTLAGLEEAEAHAHRLAYKHQAATWRFTSPLAERPNIRFIATVAELQSEGKQMRNCVGGFGNACHAGRLAAYRILGPQRCTLLLRRDTDGWNVHGLNGYANTEPSRATSSEIEQWLATEQPDQRDWLMRRLE